MSHVELRIANFFFNPFQQNCWSHMLKFYLDNRKTTSKLLRFNLDGKTYFSVIKFSIWTIVTRLPIWSFRILVLNLLVYESNTKLSCIAYNTVYKSKQFIFKLLPVCLCANVTETVTRGTNNLFLFSINLF